MTSRAPTSEVVRVRDRGRDTKYPQLRRPSVNGRTAWPVHPCRYQDSHRSSPASIPSELASNRLLRSQRLRNFAKGHDCDVALTYRVHARTWSSCSRLPILNVFRPSQRWFDRASRQNTGDRVGAKLKQKSNVQGRLMVASRGGGIEAQYSLASNSRHRSCRDPKCIIERKYPRANPVSNSSLLFDPGAGKTLNEVLLEGDEQNDNGQRHEQANCHDPSIVRRVLPL